MKIKDPTNEKYEKNEHKWCCWKLDESEIRNIAEKNGYDFTQFTNQQIEQIVERFKSWLYQSEFEWWEEWLKKSVKEVIGDN